jgi:hypothetical protein
LARSISKKDTHDPSRYEKGKNQVSALAFHYVLFLMQDRCVGVWDTVGATFDVIDALSIKDQKFLPNVEVALHALALQENRERFAPTLWDQPGSLGPNQIFKQVCEYAFMTLFKGLNIPGVVSRSAFRCRRRLRTSRAF